MYILSTLNILTDFRVLPVSHQTCDLRAIRFRSRGTSVGSLSCDSSAHDKTVVRLSLNKSLGTLTTHTIFKTFARISFVVRTFMVGLNLVKHFAAMVNLGPITCNSLEPCNDDPTATCANTKIFI